MANVALAFDILARDKASKEFNKVGDAAEKAGKKGAAFGKVMLGAVASGVAAVGVVLKTGFDEVKDYQTGVADLNNVLHTTHNAAGVTTKGLENLASSIQAYSGQTDDSIVKSEGLLLTFTNIHNAAGKNNDIFTQATKITADMAQKFGGDASDNAIRLGKALNDPARGLTALSRIGVSFTEQQKKSIKAMQAHGNMAGAQKIILAELTKEVGGSAKAYGQTLAGQVDRAKRSFEDTSQSLVTAMLPVMTKLMTFITTKLMPAFDHLTQFVIKHKSVIAPLAIVIGTIIAAVRIWTMVQAALNVVLALNPIGLVVIALAALAVGLVYAYNHSKTFRDVVQSVFHAVGAAASFMWDGVIKPVFRFLVDAWLNVVGALVHGAASAFGWVPGLGGKLKSAAKEFDKFRDTVNAALDGVHKKLNIHAQMTLTLTKQGFSSNASNTLARAGFAEGGRPPVGVASWVGERGKELFVPDQPGTILTHNESMALVGSGRPAELGGGRDGDIHITVNGALDPTAVARQIETVLTRLKRERGTRLAFT